ncbi:MAG: helix-turn-helix domain-containing protein [Prevotella sp.]|nr:helix-turn-helix domain-containing protein [Prevotella sp.]
MDTKERIRMIMEDRHMTQQVFADFLQQAPATLSSIFNGRTRPTLNIVESIKSKIPDISVEWLLFGVGDMYISHSQPVVDTPSDTPLSGQEPMLNFDTSISQVPAGQPKAHPASQFQQSVRNTPAEHVRQEIKIVDKEPRKVTEIRVYYDDQTYETFVPAKK